MDPSRWMTAARGVGAVALVALAGAACEPTMGAEVIEARVAAWARALEAGDVDQLVSRYERGGVFLPPGGTAVVGRGAIGDRWRGVLRRYDVIFDVEFQDMDADGRIGYVYGAYRISGLDRLSGDRFQIENGFLQIWRRQRDGAWLIALDVWHPPSDGRPLLPDAAAH